MEPVTLITTTDQFYTRLAISREGDQSIEVWRLNEHGKPEEVWQRLILSPDGVQTSWDIRSQQAMRDFTPQKILSGQLIPWMIDDLRKAGLAKREGDKEVVTCSKDEVWQLTWQGKQLVTIQRDELIIQNEYDDTSQYPSRTIIKSPNMKPVALVVELGEHVQVADKSFGEHDILFHGSRVDLRPPNALLDGSFDASAEYLAQTEPARLEAEEIETQPQALAQSSAVSEREKGFIHPLMFVLMAVLLLGGVFWAKRRWHRA